MNYMQEALRLAEFGRYSVAPNPMVGCVIERDGVIVGRGWHQTAGLQHAEIIALNEAGEKAAGANVYVTLEPCCHFGKTPPCVDALIAAKIKAIHIALLDPNLLINGKGVEKLRAAGVEVHVGEKANLARKQNEVFLHYIISKRPYVVAKWAMTLDGRIAADSGDSKWITAIKAREHAHYYRCWLGAVLVGANTISMDDPMLTPHLITANNIKFPWRIVLDGAGSSPESVKIFAVNPEAKTLVVTTEKAASNWRKNLALKKVEMLVLPAEQNGKVKLNLLLDELGKREITGLLVEGGQGVLTSFFKEKLVNKIHVYVAPKLIGGAKNFTPLGNMDLVNMTQSLNLTYEKYESLGKDVFFSAVPNWRDPCSPA
jgi:diaminohydroxyphosphoribosylaminopyrimidine deaminase / 5-amino-6-(5-phosphoribosylamino)uracil reductase